jgi:putative oxidoreductase
LRAACLPRTFHAMRDTGRSFGLLLARLALAALFLYAAYQGLADFGRMARAVAGAGYPAPRLLAGLALAAQIGGGLSLVLGVSTPLGCLALILFLIPTTWSFHLRHAAQPAELLAALKNLGLLGGLIALLFSGPGRFSLDVRVRGGGGGGGRR